MLKFFLITVLIVLINFSFSFGQDKEIAFQYYIQAKELFDNSSFEKSKELLLSAVEFYPDFSDALYLLAKIYKSNQETTLQSLAYYKKALKASSWISVVPSQAEKDLAELYLRIKRYNDSLAILASIKDRYSIDAKVELIRAEALRGLNRTRETLSVYQNALNAYPYNMELYLFYIDFLLEIKLNGEALAVLEKGLAEFKNQPEFLYYKVITERDATKKLELIDIYIEKGGKNPKIALIALGLKKNQKKKYIDFFIVTGGHQYIDLLDELYRTVNNNEELKQYLDQKVGKPSGEKYIDKNHDSFYEEKYIYKNGVLSRWAIDSNQDGRFELLMEFEDQKPTLVTIYDKQELQIDYHYNIYPYLKQACFYKKEIIYCYELIPATVVLSVISPQKDHNNAFARLSKHNNTLFPDENMIIKSSFSCLEYTLKPKKLIRKWDMAQGQKTKLIEDTDGNLQMDHVVIYNRGIPISGLQDLDGDGLFELIEEYEQGKLTILKFDDDGDGKPDFIQYYTAGDRKMWDLNSDGQFDVIEYKNENGQVVRQYSTRLNGVFDLTILVQ
jgi:hypothetical protein